MKKKSCKVIVNVDLHRISHCHLAIFQDLLKAVFYVQCEFDKY